MMWRTEKVFQLKSSGRKCAFGGMGIYFHAYLRLILLLLWLLLVLFFIQQVY